MATFCSKGDRFNNVTIPPEAIKATQSIATNSGVGLSPAIWSNCPMTGIRNDPGLGFYMEDDFTRLGVTPTITTIIAGLGQYSLFGSSGATILPDDAVGGGLVLTEATTNEAVSIAGESHPFRITSGGGDLWFEARIKTSTIVATKQAWFCGLMDTTAQAAAVPLTATGTIADLNIVGFHHQEANTTAFDASYKANGVSAVEVNSDIGTLEAGTYIKAGLTFDGKNTVKFYLNGLVSPTTVKVNATNFPNNEELALYLLSKQTSGSVTYSPKWDWVRVAMSESVGAF